MLLQKHFVILHLLVEFAVPDLINPTLGVKSDDFTIESLTVAIKKAMTTTYSHEDIRNEVESRFSYDIIAKQYIDLYKNCFRRIKK